MATKKGVRKGSYGNAMQIHKYGSSRGGVRM